LPKSHVIIFYKLLSIKISKFMLPSKYQKFNKAKWRWVFSCTRLIHFISLIFKLLLEGNLDLGCSSELWWRLGDCFVLIHRNGLKDQLLEREQKYVQIFGLQFYWAMNHKFSCFSFFISSFYTTNVWYVQFQIKKT
jgi:hypothetical protein